MAAPKKYGNIIRLKLTPLDKIAIISVWYAIFEVKKITAIKTNKGVNRLAK
jgi:hypothetical protein